VGSTLRTALRYVVRGALFILLLLILAAGVVAFAGGRRIAGPYDAPAHEIALPQDATAIAEGGRLAAFWGCTGCHGRDAGGQIFYETAAGDRLVTPNLTAMVRELEVSELERAIRHGVGRDGASLFGMPAGMFSGISDRDLGKVIAYLRSLPPVPDTLPASRMSLLFRLYALVDARALSAKQVDPAVRHGPGPDSLTSRSTRADTLALGRYLASTGCPECHGPELRGSEDGAPDLRIAAAYSPEQFHRLAKEGVTLSGRTGSLMTEIAQGRIARLTDDEQTALHAYLSTLAGQSPGDGEHGADAPPAAESFDGADYSTEAGMLAHGERLADLLGCNSCHASDYTGADFGAMFPVVEGLWATNISLTMPAMSDSQLERLLREGVHPTREIYLMPSKQSQFLSDRDMDALIAYLRTIEPTGEPTPLPPPDFKEAVTARLPDDYWRTTADGHPRYYHNAAEEAADYAENTVPDLGDEYAQGRLVVQTVCTSCHGAAMDGIGEPAGDIQAALEYDDRQYERLLREGVGRDGKPIELSWGSVHAPAALTDEEIAAAISYTRALARARSR
jgi:mono/diheme cytochrome c family protein